MVDLDEFCLKGKVEGSPGLVPPVLQNVSRNLFILSLHNLRKISYACHVLGHVPFPEF